MGNVAQWLGSVDDLPRHDCLTLLTEVSGLSRARIIAFPETPLTTAQEDALQQATAQLRNGSPLAYIIGRQGFWTLELEVSPDVLIPRPETELLVETALALAPPQADVLDLGTGSGAIAIAIAHTRTDLRVTAADSSGAALKIAQRNAQRYQTAIQFIHTNWFHDLRGRWDLITCNPPYIACDDPHLALLTHEPQCALISGKDGMRDLTQIIEQAPAFLRSKGYLLLEHGYDQAQRTQQLLQRRGFTEIKSLKDLAEIERVTLGCWPHA